MKNVLEGDCTFKIQITFENFQGAGNRCEATFTTGDMALPNGVYNLATLIETLDSYLEEYSVLYLCVHKRVRLVSTFTSQQHTRSNSFSLRTVVLHSMVTT